MDVQISTEQSDISTTFGIGIQSEIVNKATDPDLEKGIHQ